MITDFVDFLASSPSINTYELIQHNWVTNIKNKLAHMPVRCNGLVFITPSVPK